MPSDSHNSTMAKATDLTFSLFDIASAREVPFAMPMYIQCILHEVTRALLCVPFIFAHHERCRFCGTHGTDVYLTLHSGHFTAFILVSCQDTRYQGIFSMLNTGMKLSMH